MRTGRGRVITRGYRHPRRRRFRAVARILPVPRRAWSSSGGSAPVQRVKLRAPWRTRTSSPSTSREPPSAAHSPNGVAGAVHELHGQLADAAARRAAACPREPHGRGVHDDVRRLRPVHRARPERGAPARRRARGCGSRSATSAAPASTSAHTTARAAPPAPSTSAVRPAAGSPSAARKPPASVLSASMPVVAERSVFAAPIARAACVAESATCEGGELVRDRHVGAAVARAGQRAHGLVEELGRHGQLHVVPVEAELPERRVVHRRRARVRHGWPSTPR